MNLKKLFNTIKHVDSMGNLNVEVLGLSQKIDKVKKEKGRECTTAKRAF